jgi:DNA-directed RNA polymerase specialized sigma24 family protein
LEKERLIDLLAKSHKDWVNMAKSFGCTKEQSHELVQEMYVRLNKYIDKKDKIMYNESEVNTYYVYVTLRNLFLSGFHKGIDKNHLPLNDAVDVESSVVNYENEDTFNTLVDEIEGVVSSWYWYDKKIWDIHFYKKMSMRGIARETKISLSSIFNTLSNAKQKVREKTEEYYEEYRQTK